MVVWLLHICYSNRNLTTPRGAVGCIVRPVLAIDAAFLPGGCKADFVSLFLQLQACLPESGRHKIFSLSRSSVTLTPDGGSTSLTTTAVFCECTGVQAHDVESTMLSYLGSTFSTTVSDLMHIPRPVI